MYTLVLNKLNTNNSTDIQEEGQLDIYNMKMDYKQTGDLYNKFIDWKTAITELDKDTSSKNP